MYNTLATARSEEPPLVAMPVLNHKSSARTAKVVFAPIRPHESTVTRIMIPAIDVDSKVIEVGWTVEKLQDGSEAEVWQVAEYAVGHHRDSANPGEGENVVLAAHVGGYGRVFRDLYYVQPGDRIIVVSNGVRYLYTVQERVLVREEGVSDEQHIQNATYILPQGQELLTLITCWPLTGPDRFSSRVIVRAVPFQNTQLADGASAWSAR